MNSSLRYKHISNGYFVASALMAVSLVLGAASAAMAESAPVVLMEGGGVTVTSFDVKVEAQKIEPEARKKLLQYAGALSEKIAVILYQSGQKDNALAQLEAAKPYARRELLPESRLVFYRLGLLYQEAGKPNEARAALQEYLALTDDMQDPITQQTRPLAAAALQK